VVAEVFGRVEFRRVGREGQQVKGGGNLQGSGASLRP
jgi:hypothetical protein